jgi:hypothetical protein
MSKLPDSITGMFSDSEKQEFTTTRQDVSNEEVIQRIDREAGINDKNKSQRAVEESVKILQDKTGESDLLGSVMGGFKKMFGG